MKIFLILFTLQFCLIGLSAQTTANDPLLAEAEQLNKNVVKLYAEGKFKDALTDAKRANAIFVNKAGKDDLRTVTTFINLGQIYYQLKENKEAKSAFNDALDIFEKNIPLSAPNEKRYAELLETVAMFEGADGDVTGAEKKLTKALALSEKIYGTNAKETADVLYSLAQVYRVSGQYEKALPLILRSIDINEGKNKNDVSPEMLVTTMCMMNTIGKQDEAKELVNRFSTKVGNDESMTKDGTVIAGIKISEKATFLPSPQLPKGKRVEGETTVQVLVNEKGNVVFACSVSGPKELYETSEAAAFATKFEPTIVSGKPVKVMGYLKYMITF